MIAPRTSIACLAAVVGLAATGAQADDGICAQVERFHTASFDDEGDASRVRWIEMRWEGAFLSEEGWGFTCIRSDEAAAALCDYLVDNTSFEFPENLPQRVLECVGYVFPRPWGEWREWRSDIDLRDDGRSLLLEINLTEELPAPTVRLSSFAAGQSAATVDRPPLGRLAERSD